MRCLRENSEEVIGLWLKKLCVIYNEGAYLRLHEYTLEKSTHEIGCAALLDSCERQLKSEPPATPIREPPPPFAIQGGGGFMPKQVDAMPSVV